MAVLERDLQLQPVSLEQPQDLSIFERARLDAKLGIQDIKTSIPDVFENAFKEKELVASHQELPLKVEPFVSGSYVKKFAENEWVVTQDGAALPGDPTYGINNPLEMRALHAPRAGEKARAIMEKGRRADKPLSTEREVTLKEAKETFAMFVQMSGKRGEAYGGSNGIITNDSQGIPWDRQTPIEDAARSIARSIAGDPNAPIVWFGPHKLLVVVEGDQSHEDMLDRFNKAPIAAYENDPRLAHLAPAVRALQEERVETEKDNRETSMASFNGDGEMVRAFKEGQKFSTYNWNYFQKGEDLVALNPDKTEQTMMDLARNARVEDIDMKNKLASANTTITQNRQKNFHVIEVNFDPTATCCGFSSNTQQEELKSLSLHQLRAVMSGFVTINTSPFPFALGKDTDKYVCKKCRRMDVCVCNADESDGGNES